MTVCNILERYWAPSSNFKIVDVGCYPGVFGAIVKSRFSNITLDGVGLGLTDDFKQHTSHVYSSFFEVELDPFYPQHYRDVIPENTIPVKDSTYDVVIASEIFEHLYNPLHFIRETSRILKPGGILILSTPNICYAGNILRLIAGKSIHEELKTSHIFMDNDWRPHMRVYDRNEIKTLLSEAFTEEDVTIIDNKEDRFLSKMEIKMKIKMFLIRMFYIFPRFRNQYIGVFRKSR